MECKIYHSNSQYKDLLMKVLLTGHTGFIGQNLLNSLLKKKIKLFVTKYNNLKIPRNKSISIIDLKKKNNSFSVHSFVTLNRKTAKNTFLVCISTFITCKFW